MELVNETLYTRVTLDALMRINYYTVGRQKLLRNRLLCLLVGLLGLGMGYVFDLGGDLLTRLSQAYGFLFLFLALFWVPLQCLPNFLNGRRPERRRLRFREAAFGPDVEDAPQYPYAELRDVVESQDWIALFWDEKHGLILDRAGFQEGTGEELIRHLEATTNLHIIKIFANGKAANQGGNTP